MVSAKGSQRSGTTAWLTPGYNVTSHTVTSLLTVWVWASVTCAEWSLKSLTSWVLFTVTCGSYGEWAITINPYWGGGLCRARREAAPAGWKHMWELPLFYRQVHLHDWEILHVSLREWRICLPSPKDLYLNGRGWCWVKCFISCLLSRQSL